MVALRNKPDLATVVHRFGKALLQEKSLNAVQIKALHNITECRTASMGGHKQECDHCHETRYSYNSCGDRHCPKCQSLKQAQWIEDVMQVTLPIKHYHIIFTVPHVLNNVCLWNPSVYYNLLFSAVWRTLHSFGYSEYGVETGAIAVLHSWGQNLSLHPHIHCIVPAAGYSLKGEWKRIGEPRFLYSVHALSKTFKGKFLDSLKRKLRKMDMEQAFNKEIQLAYKPDWVVFSEASMGSAEHVVRYLGQYTHRVAISNHRILDVTDMHVRFVSKDYRDGARQKVVSLKGEEFLRRFSQHVFPKRFVRIRRFGIYHPTTIRGLELQFYTGQELAPKSIKVKKKCSSERIKKLLGFDPEICPKCKKGHMRVVETMPRIRSPAAHLPTLLLSKLL